MLSVEKYLHITSLFQYFKHVLAWVITGKNIMKPLVNELYVPIIGSAIGIGRKSGYKRQVSVSVKKCSKPDQ